MAEAVAARAARESWVALYASPLLRTRQTAAPVAQRIGLPVEIEPRLREISYGDWEGTPAAEIRRTDADRYRTWVEHPGQVAPPGGETGAAVAARAVPAVEEIVRRHPDGRVLVVAHKTTIRIIVCSLLGIALDLYRVRIAAPVASFTAIEFQDTGPILTLLGDASHVPERLWDGGGPMAGG
jgi:alpha-ribazole phosphatase